MKLRKTKILHVQVIPKFSGVQKVSLDILSNLDDSYDKYIMFGGSYSIDQALEKELVAHNIKIIYVDTLRREIGTHDLQCLFSLIKIFSHEKFDIIHTNSTKPGILGRIAAKVSGCKKIIHTLHGISFHSREHFIKRIIYWLLDYICSFLSDNLVSVNAYYLKFFPFIKNKKVIHNALSFHSAESPSRREPYYGGKITIGFLSRLDYQKDPLTFLKAIKYIKESTIYGELIHAKIGGDGDLKNECVDFVHENNLLDSVDFLGWVNNKQIFFDSIDVFCLPSIYEAFGLVFLEAGYYKKPVISTNVEGIPEVVVDNQTGFLIEPMNYVDLANKIISFIDDPISIVNMGENGFKRVTHKFNFSEMMGCYEKLYQEKDFIS